MNTQPSILESMKRFPTFEYKAQTLVFYINQATPLDFINELIHRVKNIKQFTIATKYDYTLNHPCLIQICFSEHIKTYLILIEVRYLPSSTGILFQRIQFLLSIILSPSNLLQSWGDLKHELRHFLFHNLFSFQQIEQIQVVNVQQKFKRWFDKIFDHTTECYELYDNMNDNSNCICLHRPLKHTYDEWSLHMAIGFISQQYLDTSFIYSNWNIGLYLQVHIPSFQEDHNYNCINDAFHLRIEYEKRCRSILNEYVVKECLAINKLASFLQNVLIRKHKEEYLKNYYMDH
jgi:hypothetical protein